MRRESGPLLMWPLRSPALRCSGPQIRSWPDRGCAAGRRSIKTRVAQGPNETPERGCKDVCVCGRRRQNP